MRIGGRDVGSLAPLERLALRRRIGFAPGGADLPGHVTVERGLLYIAALWQVAGAAPVRREIARWDLGRVGRRPLGSLSPGERRRFILAASRVMDPELWLLERPYDGLDAIGRATVDALVADAFFGRGPVRTLLVADNRTEAGKLPHNARCWVSAGTVMPL
jgi:ABC-type multidrug transport system ATPase subunit